MKQLIFLLLMSAAFAKSKPIVPVTLAANPEAVKQAAVSQAVSEGYSIENQSQFQIVFVKNMTGFGGRMMSGFLSPPGCNQSPRNIFTLVLVPSGENTDVTTHYELEYAGGACVPVKQSQDKDKRKYVESFMEKVKATLESTALRNPQ